MTSAALWLVSALTCEFSLGWRVDIIYGGTCFWFCGWVTKGCGGVFFGLGVSFGFWMGGCGFLLFWCGC